MNELDYIKENALRIIDEVCNAKAKYRSSSDKLDIMAVTKTVSPEAVNTAISCGITLLGENRVQEYTSKKGSYLPTARVDFIGHLQSNKVKYIIDDISIIQSVDSIPLAKEINRLSLAHGIVKDVFVEVNIGREETKSGVLPEMLEETLFNLSEMRNINVCGLMSIPPKGSPEKFFSQMNELFIDIKAKNIDNINVSVLSMGMSSDYITAIKHGSNLVRIGTALFGARK